MFRFNLPNRTQLIVVAVIIFFVGAYYAGFGRYSVYYLRAALNPMLGASHYLSQSLADFFSLYLSREDLAAKNKQLAEQNIELARENGSLKIMRKENEALRQALAFTEDSSYAYVLARVIGQPLSASPTEILINKGRERGLAENQAVTNETGVIIGKISAVGDNFARVKLLIDNNSKLAVLVYGNEPGHGLALGQHNLNLRAEMLTKDLIIKTGDFVATSGLEEDIPAGLIVGRVARVDKNEEKLWQEVLIEPALSGELPRLVIVILSQK